jgi:polyisoprenyl-phosphate glycosyltransferase
VTASLEQVTSEWNVVYVDDHSTDGAWERLVELAGADPRVRAYRLSRNFGQHVAITAGLAHSDADWTVVMDCDLEDRPEEIPRLHATAVRGHEIVLTRRNRSAQGLFRRSGGRTYNRIRNLLLRTDMGIDYATLSILSRRVVEAFLSVPGRRRQYQLILHRLGFDRAVLETEDGERHAGGSSYGFRALVRYALDGILFRGSSRVEGRPLYVIDRIASQGEDQPTDAAVSR